MDNLGSLAAVYDHSLSAEGIDGYTRALMDLSPEELHHGFTRSLRELKWWPKPVELREMCTGRAAAMTDMLRIDAAWNWTQQYIEMFGVPAFGYAAKNRWEIQGQTFNGSTPDIAIRSSHSAVTLMTTAPFYEISVTAVPVIPELLKQTLISMSASVEVGLTRIKDAMKVGNGLDGSPSKDSAFARKDFDHYCESAIAATRVPGASQVIPARQLTGHVAPEFTVPKPRSIAVRVAVGFEGYAIRRLTLDEATELYDANRLPLDLYEDALRHHERVEAEKTFLNTPAEFNAIYLGRYRPLEQRDSQEPYRMGRFTIESADGSRIVRESLQMGVGSMQLEKGQVVHFTAKPSDLFYEEYQVFYFDLHSMSAHHAAFQPLNLGTTAKEISCSTL